MRFIATIVFKLLVYKYVALVTIVSLLFFVAVDPTRASSLVIVIGSVLLAAMLYVWVAFIVDVTAMFQPIAARSRRILALLVAGTATFLLLLQSIGELSWRDVLAIVPLAAGVYVYMVYLAKPRSPSPR